MTDEEIFDLADQYGWMDDFGRWNLPEDRLISFALAVLRVNQQEPACWINGKELAGMRASATHWGASEWKTNLGLKPMPDDVPLYTAPVMSEKHGDFLTKDRHEFECPRCGHCCQQREWVGLTDDEVFNIYKQFDSLQYKSFAKAIEAKLKEKNA